eukprot:UN04534
MYTTTHRVLFRNLRQPSRYTQHASLVLRPSNNRAFSTNHSIPQQHNTPKHNSTLDEMVIQLQQSFNSPEQIPTHIKDKIIANLQEAQELLNYAAAHPEYLAPNLRKRSTNAQPQIHHKCMQVDNYIKEKQISNNNNDIVQNLENKAINYPWSCLPYSTTELSRLTTLPQNNIIIQYHYRAQMQAYYNMSPNHTNNYTPTQPHGFLLASF